MNWKIFGKIIKIFRADIEFLNYLIYEILLKFRKNFDKIELHFMRIMKGFKNIMRKNLGYLVFSRKNARNFYKNWIYLWNYWKIFKKLGQFWRNFLEISEKFLSYEEFLKYCYDISMKFWTIFDKVLWNFNKNVHKNFIRIMKIFWKNMRGFRVYFVEIKSRMRKILRKFENIERNFLEDFEET